jgi:PadR family transcriptional regulator, regulatory protein PadR
MRAEETRELLPGTLDMLILKVLSRGEMHGYGIVSAIQLASDGVLGVEGALYRRSTALRCAPGCARSGARPTTTGARSSTGAARSAGARSKRKRPTGIVSHPRSRARYRGRDRVISDVISWWKRLLTLLRPGRRRREIDDEIAFHLAMRRAAHATLRASPRS